MGQATEKSQGVETDFRIRPNVLMDFAHLWAERHGHHGGFSITRLAEKIKTRVVADLANGQAIPSKLRNGQMVKVVDLSDALSGFVYYAMVDKTNGHEELVNILGASELEEMTGPGGNGGNEETTAAASAESEIGISPVDKIEKIDVGADELVLLRYSRKDDEVQTQEVKRGELQGMILKLLADGIAIDTMKVWCNGRRPQIDVKL